MVDLPLQVRRAGRRALDWSLELARIRLARNRGRPPATKTQQVDHKAQYLHNKQSDNRASGSCNNSRPVRLWFTLSFGLKFNDGCYRLSAEFQH